MNLFYLGKVSSLVSIAVLSILVLSSIFCEVNLYDFLHGGGELVVLLLGKIFRKGNDFFIIMVIGVT